jgi:hypothetical protein
MRFLRLAFAPFPDVWGWLQVLASLAVLAGSAFLSEIVEAFPWYLLPLLLSILLLFWAGVRLQLENDRSAYGRLVFGEPRVVAGRPELLREEREPKGRVLEQFVETPPSILDVVKISVRNDPPGHRPEAAIRDAHLRVVFESAGQTFTSDGAWAIQVARLARENPPADLGRMLLPPNGQDIDVYVAHKAPGERAHAVSSKVWASGGRGRKLTEDEYLVRVEVAGTGLAVPAVCEFRLSTPSQGKLEIR